MSKKTKRSISTFAILLAVMLLVSIATWLAAGKTYTGENGEMAEVVGASASDIFMGPVNGFADASDVITFVFCLGAFLAIVNATGALETGIHTLVRKLHGKELVLIWILMFLFSVGGTTYGMGEETVGFYILLAATMMAAGFDPIVGAATVLLGAGTGVLGSTINPFATGAAVAAATSVGVEVNMGTTYVIGIILWLSAYLLSVLFVTAYAKKVRANKGSILTAAQLDECQKAYGGKDVTTAKLTGRQKAVLWLFALSFVVMILGFIPWGEFVGYEDAGAYGFFSHTTTWLTGAGLGETLTRSEFVDRALRQAVTRESSRLQSGMVLLATVGATAPFVGLLGTVWGIYGALIKIGATGSASIDAVAGPVGEALIMTAIGLFVAIPAVFAYNFFSKINSATIARYDAFAHDLHDFFATGSRVR